MLRSSECAHFDADAVAFAVAFLVGVKRGGPRERIIYRLATMLARRRRGRRRRVERSIAFQTGGEEGCEVGIGPIRRRKMAREPWLPLGNAGYFSSTNPRSTERRHVSGARHFRYRRIQGPEHFPLGACRQFRPISSDSFSVRLGPA